MNSKQVSLDEVISANKKWFLSFGLTEENIRSYYPVWKKERKEEGTFYNYVWYLFNLLLAENEKQTQDKRQFHNYRASILKRMMEFARSFEGRDGNDLLCQLELERMYEYELCPYEVEVEISSGQCCPWCDALNGKRYSIEEYRRQQPLGSPGCTNENGCTCRTVPIPVTAANGDLVMRK